MQISRRKMLKATGASLFLSHVMWGTRSTWGANGSKKAYALHIGVDEINDVAYSKQGLRFKKLSGCVNDAKAYQDITGNRGFNVRHLHNADATVKNVYGHIVWAAQELGDGDLMVVTYAGHGSQVPDKSKPRDELDDGKDETLCLHDRMLIDDELALIWGQFDRGVRILFISDSCSSGSVARAQDAARGLSEQLRSQDPDVKEIRGLFGTDQQLEATRSVAEHYAERGNQADVNARGTVRAGDNLVPLFRSLSDSEASEAYETQRAKLDQVNARMRIGDSRAQTAIKASGLLLAACKDRQQAGEMNGQGYFTGVLKNSLEKAADYRSLLTDVSEKVSRLSGGTQVPNFYPFGTDDVSFYQQKPFQL